MAAKALNFEGDLDVDLAFDLQMEEAIAASLALHPSTSHSPPPSASSRPIIFEKSDIWASPDHRALGDEVDLEDLMVSLMLEDFVKISREQQDREQSQVEMMKLKEDLDRRIHDQNLASAIFNMPDDEWDEYGDDFDLDRLFHDQNLASDMFNLPDDEWDEYGDDFEMPYGTDVSAVGTSRSALDNAKSFKLYFKGLVSEERVGNVKVTVAAVGVAVCDPRDNLLMEVRKPLEVVQGREVLSSELAELMALIEGLEAARAFPLERVSFFCDDYMLYQYVTGRLPPRLSKIASLVDKVALLRGKFTYCEPFLIARNDVKFAFKLAKDAIVSQIKLPAETGKGRNLLENCRICFEDTDLGQMFAVDGCLHRYCFSCMKQHVEVKFLGGSKAKCPHEGCESTVSIESCRKLLPPKLIEIISQRLKETSIPVSEKVYCPDPRCSALMSKAEVLEYTKDMYGNARQSGVRKCMKCHRLFCIKCKISWHYGTTCDDYSQLSTDIPTEDAKLKSLATEKLWRQCASCNHLVELAEGCYHITCRCGYEFCYTCGAEWKNKKPTCSCPIWDEHNIIRDE